MPKTPGSEQINVFLVERRWVLIWLYFVLLSRCKAFPPEVFLHTNVLWEIDYYFTKWTRINNKRFLSALLRRLIMIRKNIIKNYFRGLIAERTNSKPEERSTDHEHAEILVSNIDHCLASFQVDAWFDSNIWHWWRCKCKRSSRLVDFYFLKEMEWVTLCIFSYGLFHIRWLYRRLDLVFGRQTPSLFFRPHNLMLIAHYDFEKLELNAPSRCGLMFLTWHFWPINWCPTQIYVFLLFRTVRLMKHILELHLEKMTWVLRKSYPTIPKASQNRNLVWRVVLLTQVCMHV